MVLKLQIATLSQIEHGLLIIGYSLAFGAVLAKMWRVYQVFHNPTPNKKV
jgi:gamma-aminobutyric acid type B receptor